VSTTEIVDRIRCIRGGAKFTGEFLLLFPTNDGNSSKSHAPGELDSEMPQTAEALYGDEIARAQVGVPERVIGLCPPAQSSCAASAGVTPSGIEAKARDQRLRLLHIRHRL
jgi:hypothetical protein